MVLEQTSVNILMSKFMDSNSILKRNYHMHKTKLTGKVKFRMHAT